MDTKAGARERKHYKSEIPHTPGHTAVQGKVFYSFLPFKARYFSVNLGTVRLG